MSSLCFPCSLLSLQPGFPCARCVLCGVPHLCSERDGFLELAPKVGQVSAVAEDGSLVGARDDQPHRHASLGGPKEELAVPEPALVLHRPAAVELDLVRRAELARVVDRGARRARVEKTLLPIALRNVAIKRKPTRGQPTKRQR